MATYVEGIPTAALCGSVKYQIAVQLPGQPSSFVRSQVKTRPVTIDREIFVAISTFTTLLAISTASWS